jgi:RNA 2',3'-cyclic 3'-phosphodiesterase
VSRSAPAGRRLFAAVDPPAEAITDLDGSVRRKGTDLRWVPATQWHITTAFYGEVDPATTEELESRLESAAARTPPFRLQIKGAGCFPRRPLAARVLWAGLVGDLSELSRLADRCVAAGGRSGIVMEKRKFQAHLTVARARVPTDLSGRLAELWFYAGPTWTTSTLRLVHSTLGAKVRHETVADWPLAGAPSP